MRSHAKCNSPENATRMILADSRALVLTAEIYRIKTDPRPQQSEINRFVLVDKQYLHRMSGNCYSSESKNNCLHLIVNDKLDSESKKSVSKCYSYSMNR
jgi:hypothetical protein